MERIVKGLKEMNEAGEKAVVLLVVVVVII